MALISCPDCKREVSDLARTCPQCGYPFGNQLGISLQDEANKQKMPIIQGSCVHRKRLEPNSLLADVFLTILTLGLYWIYYMYRFTVDVDKHIDMRGDRHWTRIVRLSLIGAVALVFIWVASTILLSLLLAYQHPEIIRRAQAGYVTILPVPFMVWSFVNEIMACVSACMFNLPLLALIGKAYRASLMSVDGRGIVVSKYIAIAAPACNLLLDVVGNIWLMNRTTIDGTVLTSTSGYKIIEALSMTLAIVSFSSGILVIVVSMLSVRYLWRQHSLCSDASRKTGADASIAHSLGSDVTVSAYQCSAMNQRFDTQPTAVSGSTGGHEAAQFQVARNGFVLFIVATVVSVATFRVVDSVVSGELTPLLVSCFLTYFLVMPAVVWRITATERR